MSQTSPAILVLADGTVFRGTAIGASGSSVGEVVFNTSMTGYQEILTDPSYCKQIVTLTYPHIGNVGCNAEDVESRQVFASGLIIRDLSMTVSNFRSTQSLPEYLKANNVVAIAGIDTRKLTRILRDQGRAERLHRHGRRRGSGAEGGARFCRTGRHGSGASGDAATNPMSGNSACGSWARVIARAPTSKFHVVAYDFGVKRNILRMLAERGCRITVVPAKTGAADVLAMKPDGVFLSNGPGDPEPCDYAIDGNTQFIEAGIPLFGICLGHQIMGLAVGRKDREDEIRPSRRQPSGAGHADQARDDHQPEPRLCGRCGDAAEECARHPRLAVRRHAAGLRTDRQARVLLPGPPRGEPGAA